PGNPDGTLAERLAHAAFTEFIQGADGLVDAHCGDMVEALEPFAMFEAGPAEAKAKALAEAYGLGYVMRQEPGPDRAVGGTTSAAGAQIGVAAITAEAGGCGLGRVLTAMGMADPGANGVPAGAGEPGAPEYLGRFLWLRCAQEGWWEPAV